MADGDIVLRVPGGTAGDISFGGAPAPVDGTADAELPALAAAAVGALSLVGVATASLSALGAAGTGALRFTGTAAAALPVVAADGAGALGFTGEADAALPTLAADGDGLQVFTGQAVVALSALEADATGAQGFAGAGAAALPALTASGTGALTLAFVGTAAVSLPAMGAAAAGALRFVGIGDATLPALAVDASGTVTTSGDDDEPAFITLPRAGALYELSLPAVASLYTITLARPMGRLHIGDTAVIAGITVRDSAGSLVDPATLTVLVLTPLGTEVELVYGTAPTSGSGDAIIRTAAGTFTLQIEITEERGAGVYQYTVVTTGARAAEPSTFTVYARAV